MTAVNIIPKPVEVKEKEGFFNLTPRLTIQADEANQSNAAILGELLAKPTGFVTLTQPPPFEERKWGMDREGVTAGGGQEGVISLECTGQDPRLGREGYRLIVQPGGVKITAPTPAGVFYGIQSLRQLLPVEVERRTTVSGVEWKIPCVAITDYPRFAWRGYMFDEGRNFHGKEEVLRILDLLAMQKMNVLHWHLTEDQGWRIEIRRYPRLTEVGARRAGTSPGILGKPDGIAHAGFYTQAEIKEVVAYAAERHITIVPEVEMPGHSLAALAAYPELSCRGGPFEVATHFGIYSDIYCAGKEAVFLFLQNVLDEVMELFPSPYIHIGGDEAPKKRWKACPDCRRRMLDENIPDAHALQGYFTNRIAAHLGSQRRSLIGWDQIVKPGLVENALVQYWIGSRKKLLDAIRQGRKVIVSSYLNTYLDHSHCLTPLSKAYSFEPVFAELDEIDAGNILGLEPPLWGEFVRNRARIDYQTYPRLTAFAETGWTPRAQKDYAGFLRRLPVFLSRFDELGVKYAPLAEAEPPRWKQLFGIFTIPQPQMRTAGGG